MPLRDAVRLVLAGLALLAVRHVSAQEVVLPAPGTDGWRPLLLPRVDRTTTYVPFEVEGVRGVRSKSRCSASALVLPLDDVDLGRTPRLSWRWRVLEALSIEDERVKSGDDFAARVYVTFPFVREGAGVWERMRRRLAESLFGDQVPGSALNYVWSSSEPAGATWDNPFVAQSKMISLGPGPVGRWRDAEIDLRADYLALFGREPPKPSGIAIMTDSDNSCGRASAEFAAFRASGT